MATLLITHPGFTNHDTGPHHPESPERMRVIGKVLGGEDFKGLLRRAASRRDDADTYISLTHSPDYLARLRGMAAPEHEGLHNIDGDTVVSPGTWEAAMRAVCSGLDAVDALMEKQAANAFCQVRPPGHHAESERAMGFCFFNNAAIAANYARHKYKAERPAILDFDVHHGNGTQEIFWSDKNTFYGSTHQMPLYPGTGAINETGAGNITNAPLREGDGTRQFREAFGGRVLGALDAFRPDFVIVSAGFDAHADDPLGGLQLHERDFAWATEKIGDIARRYANGRIVSMLEGGYNLTALAGSVAVHVKTLMQIGA